MEFSAIIKNCFAKDCVTNTKLSPCDKWGRKPIKPDDLSMVTRCSQSGPPCLALDISVPTTYWASLMAPWVKDLPGVWKT